MNRLHRWYCRTDAWRRTVEGRLFPWVLNEIELGETPLELGPGPGLTTDFLEPRVRHLTTIEIDPRLAAALRDRVSPNRVTVVEGDATNMPFEDQTFSGAVALTMLHHVPSPELQDRLLREVQRVLRPEGWFVGSDSITSWLFRLIHMGDTLVPIEPSRFGARLEQAGFRDVRVDVRRGVFRFRARR